MAYFNDRRDNNPPIDITQPPAPPRKRPTHPRAGSAIHDLGYSVPVLGSVMGGMDAVKAAGGPSKVINNVSKSADKIAVDTVKNAVSVVKQGTNFVHDLGYGIPFLGDAMRAEDAAKAAKKSKIASADQQRWINRVKKTTESSAVKVKKAPITRMSK